MSNFVFVLDTNGKPLNLCKPGVARSLLKAQKASVYRMFPFTIILKKVVDIEPEHFDAAQCKPLQLKIDPGSKVTGLAILMGSALIWAAELTHRGQAIKASLESRRACRRNRRARHTRYRQPRFLNRTRPKGWLAPSLMHRVYTTDTWVKRLMRLAPIGSIAQELVRFDLQQLEAPEISGIEYQQGELAGYEVREYLLNKWDRKCTYCAIENVPLQIEHINPKAKGGSNRISNLCLACEKCNLKKGTKDIQVFLAKKPDLLKRILAQSKRPLKDAAAVNSTRWALLNALKDTGLPITTGSGGRTKFNRTSQGLPKTHFFDAACVGDTPILDVLTNQPLLIKATGWGCRQMIPSDKYGFPRRGYAAKQKVQGWNTGDIVSVVSGKHIGLTAKRLKTVRFKGNFDIRLSPDKVISVSRNALKHVFKKDGYSYGFA